MSKYRKSLYVYSKKRKDFGRQPLFQMVPGHLLDSIYSDKEEQRQYILRNPVNREVQATMPLTEHEAGTKRVIMHEQGINHEEGGWPRDVQPTNEEHVLRHRRRVLHDENYIHTVMNLTPIIKHYVDQNNAINMYENYFSDMQPQDPVEKYVIRVDNAFRDPFRRPVSCITWTVEKPSKIAVAYCDMSMPLEPESKKSNDCYLWDVCIQTGPVHTLKPEFPCWQLACSPVEPEILVTGLHNGTVSIFDLREGQKSVSSSDIYTSHFGPITSLMYTHTRTNTEFFTGSLDGQCMWWDMRNLSVPTDRMIMTGKLLPGQEPNLNNARGVTALHYDRNLPTKFLCGTEAGNIINVNRMGRNNSEILGAQWDAHPGPVRTVRRSPCTSRMFLSCSDWTVRVWSEEVRSAPIIVTRPYPDQVTDAAWAPLRYSSYMVTCNNGVFYYWDFLRKHKEAVASLQVSKQSLTKVAAHHKGSQIAVGDSEGCVFLLEVSENMAISGSKDKQLMYTTYERETKREHILEARVREIRLKLRNEEEAAAAPPVEEPDEDELIQKAEEEYFRFVNEGLRDMDLNSSSNYSLTGK